MDIFFAIEHSDKELLERIIKKGIEVNISDMYGQTPLHLAIDTAFEEAIYIFDTKGKLVQPRMDIIEILLRNGADYLRKDQKGKSPIDWAKERNYDVFTRKLIELVKEIHN